MTIRIERIRSLDQIRRILQSSESVDVHAADRDAIYAFIHRTLVKFDYHDLRKPDKGLLKAYLARTTGLSRAQLTRLIAQHRTTGEIRDRRRRPDGELRAPAARRAARSVSRRLRSGRETD